MKKVIFILGISNLILVILYYLKITKPVKDNFPNGFKVISSMHQTKRRA